MKIHFQPFGPSERSQHCSIFLLPPFISPYWWSMFSSIPGGGEDQQGFAGSRSAAVFGTRRPAGLFCATPRLASPNLPVKVGPPFSRAFILSLRPNWKIIIIFLNSQERRCSGIVQRGSREVERGSGEEERGGAVTAAANSLQGHQTLKQEPDNHLTLLSSCIF